MCRPGISAYYYPRAEFIAFGLATAGRDPIQRTYSEAGRELETAMDRLSDVAIACSTEIVAAVEMGGASVKCEQDVRTRWVSEGPIWADPHVFGLEPERVRVVILLRG